jgi:GTPase SAR1 family protein
MNIYNEKLPNISLICAPPASGKTYLIKYLLTDLYKKKKIDYGVVFCSTSFNKDNFDYIPENYLYSSYDENIILNLMNIQQQQIDFNDKAKPAFIVFDDMLGLIKFDSKLIIELFTKYRHYNITILITTQYIYAIPPLLRECTTFFFTFYLSSYRSLKAIYDCFLGDFDNYKECKKFIIDNTGDYKFIVVKTFESNKNKKFNVCKAPKIKNINFKF